MPRRPEQPEPDDIPLDEAEQPAEPEGLPLQTQAQLVSMVEKLFERVDRNEEGSAELLKAVLAQHSHTLKATLSPENRLHPDVSDYNPRGERDHPRDKLIRPCYFLGIPLEQPSLTVSEIALLNSVNTALELPAPNGTGKWRVAFLRDGTGGEALYVSVPFKGFDDLRSLPEGWQGVVRTLQAGGFAPANQDSLLARINALEEVIRALAPQITQ